MTLLNSKPMIVDKSLAAIVGLNEALVLQQLDYWIEINKKNKRNCHDGKFWTYIVLGHMTPGNTILYQNNKRK